MKAKFECLPCFLDDLSVASQILLSEGERGILLKEALRFLSEKFDLQKTPSYYVTHLHRLLKKISGIKFPFEERRRECNKMSLAIAQKVKKERNSLAREKAFTYLVRWAIAGNALDYRTIGAGYSFPIETMEKILFRFFQKGLAVDETNLLWKKIQTSSKILYIQIMWVK